jgi:hypothetical protein
MRIGLIGSGHIGGTVTRRWTALGHEVRIANRRGPQSLQDLAAATGATAVTVPEAVKGADLVVVTIPEKAVPDLPADLFAGAPDSLVVMDTGNYYWQREGRIAAIEDGLTESRWVAQQLGRSEVKVFNNINFMHLLDLGKPADTAGRIALPVAGDDPRATTVVMHLVDELGFDPVDAGTVDESWRQQPGTPVYTTDLDDGGVRRALAAASPERNPEFRATPTSPGTFTAPA